MEASPHLTSRRGPFSGSRLLQTQPDAVLCRLAMRGNAGAYEALYNRHHGPLYGFVFHLLGRSASAEDAQDIAQESFSTAFSKLAARREDGSFKSWLFTIARNRTFDQLRAGRPPMADVTELSLAAAGGPEHQAESKAEMAWLMAALADLPERQREALVMREMGGLSYGEIAEGMQATVPSVKQLINRARDTLSEAPDGDDLRPRRLRKELAALVPVLPMAVTSVGVAAFGVAGTTAGAGGISVATKVAAVALTVAAIGGGAAGLTASSGEHSNAGATAGASATGDATDNAALRDDHSSSGGDDSRDGVGDGSGRGSGDHRGDSNGDSRDDSSDDQSDDPAHPRRGSSRSESGDEPASHESEASDDHSGSGSGDDAPEAAETRETEDPDHPEVGDSGDDDPESASSGSGSESQSSGSEHTLEIED